MSEAALNTNVNLTDHQLSAVFGAMDAINAGQDFKIGGYAGTGKSTVLSKLAVLKPGAIVCTYTGKAADVLRNKGVDAATIHSTIYYYNEKKDHFFLKNAVDGEYFAVDEASMVSQRLANDIRSFGLPIVYFGDPGQLEPPEKLQAIGIKRPDAMLSKIHRQAQKSDIIRLSADIRQGLVPPWDNFEPILDETGSVELFDRHDFWDEDFEWADQVLCGFNRTRARVNSTIRARRAWENPIEVGERLMVLCNNRRINVFNGMQFTVKEKIDDDDPYFCEAIVQTDSGETREMFLYKGWLGQKDLPPRDVAQRFVRGIWALVDYAYCATVHKFQGSEADRVILLDEQCSKWDAKKHRYTGVTRAAKELRVFKSDIE